MVIYIARLNESQLKYKLNREIKKANAAKKKAEISQEKEIFGEQEWIEAEKKKREKELADYVSKKKDKTEETKEAEVKKKEGKILVPKSGVASATLFDFVDLANFFKPITYFKDKFGKNYKIHFDKFEESKEAYEEALEDLNVTMYDDEVKALWEANEDEYAKDYDNGTPEYQEVKNDFYKDAFGNFQEFVPIYDKYICTCCGRPLDITDYYINFDYSNLTKIDFHGNIRTNICKDCANKLFNYYYTEKTEKDAEKAMKMFCASQNIYWDVELFMQALKNKGLNDDKKHIVGEYIDCVNSNPNSLGKTFLDSPFLDDKYESDVHISETDNAKGKKKLSLDNDGLLNWTKEELKNRKTVINMLGYDVFAYETDKNRKMLYSDLLGMIEPGMEQDGVKMQAAIQIVTSYLNIRELNEEYKVKQKEKAPIAELSAISKLRKTEMDGISAFARDNGFSERFATAKAKGENTFTGILNKMNEDKFENAILNKYDIETSATIQQAADASMKAIFQQLSLGESEVWKIAQDQLQELIKLRKDNDRLQEELRLAKYDLAKNNLIKKAKEQGVYNEEEDEDE